MRLTAENFFSHLIFHPFQADTNRDKAIALIAAIVCSIFSIGICPLVCAILRNFKHKKPDELNSLDKKVSDVGINTLPANDDVKPKETEIENKQVATPTLAELFNNVIDTSNPTRPKLKQNDNYQVLIERRLDLAKDQQNLLFYAELLSVCNDEGILLSDASSPQKLEEFARTFLSQPDGTWEKETQNLYRSILQEDLSKKYKIHYDDAEKLTKATLKGQELIIQVAKDDGDCLFLSFISGLTETNPPSVEDLRKLASQELLKAIEQPDSEGLIYQLAEGMRMHNEAHDGAPKEDLIRLTFEVEGFPALKEQFQDNAELNACQTPEDFFVEWRRQHPPMEDKSDPRELATEYCNRLVNPKEIYPGEETIKILAEKLNQPIVIVNGDSLRSFGPALDEDIIPIFIYKMPGNAHYNRLVVDKDQWKTLRHFCN